MRSKVKSSKTNNALERWLRTQLPNPYVHSLPLTHVSPWDRFQKIADDGYLKPSFCPIFKQEVLYLSYGDLAFRPSRDKPKWNDRFPVIIAFHPRIIVNMSRFFPFDTGAISAGRFRGLYLGRNSDFRTYAIPYTSETTPKSWISSYFGSNRRYLKRTISTQLASGVDEILCLRDACTYCEWAQDEGIPVDHHLVCTIECHFARRISLENTIVWIGAPTAIRKEFGLIVDRLAFRGQVFYYEEQEGNAGLTQNVIDQAQKIIHKYV